MTTFEQDWSQAWTFTSTLTRPDGLKFEVVCTVSPEDYGDDFPELSEITQMAIGRIATDLRRNERIKVADSRLAGLSPTAIALTFPDGAPTGGD